MKFLLLSLVLTSQMVFASEVITLDYTVQPTEILIRITDDSLYSGFDKNFLPSNCRPRSSINGLGLKEIYLAKSCRAELLKFILSSGYKPLDQHASSFYK